MKIIWSSLEARLYQSDVTRSSFWSSPKAKYRPSCTLTVTECPLQTLVLNVGRVTPVHPETKMGVMKNWQITTPAEVLKYSKGKYAKHNVGVVGKRGVGRHCFLDVDAPGVVERIESETKHEMPKGYRVKSSPTSKPYKTHFYFKPVLSGRRRWESSQSIEGEWISGDLSFFRFELR